MTTCSATAAPSATEALARFTGETAGDDLPDELRARLRGLFLDHIGVATFAAARADSSSAVHAAVDRLDGGGGRGTVIGVHRRYTSTGALSRWLTRRRRSDTTFTAACCGSPAPWR